MNNGWAILHFQFKSAIHDILKGHKYIHTYFSRMSNGCQNEEIANQLNISDRTVKNHVSSIMKKLKVKNQMHAVLAAIRNNWVSM
ncbi:response regulator transcription factor [Oceanobacillus sp. AG]|uniref:response regulator transcription factor n=1 Tax=Oceanobacillus sp. AG TaxID=2681969 RepID=UPI0012EB3410|nr:LuxR C-terminal-related transcriptional regulator [Oceanobacillus sp. AG]